jgi:hypothetical protein
MVKTKDNQQYQPGTDLPFYKSRLLLISIALSGFYAQMQGKTINQVLLK